DRAFAPPSWRQGAPLESPRNRFSPAECRCRVLDYLRSAGSPRVSVVLPTYNRMAPLDRAARSVLGQGSPDLELLDVDHGPTDETAALVTRLAAQDPRVRLLRQANAGAAAARNTGIEAARGELVAFQDSDDEWLPGHLEGQLQLLARQPEAVVAYSRMV